MAVVKTKTLKCINCGGVMKRETVSRTIRVGARSVSDASTSTMVCTKCGEYELSHGTLLKSERRAALVVLTDVQGIDGAELRYARKALGLTQEKLANALGAASATVSRWETGALAIDRTVQLAVAQLLTMTERDPDGFKRIILPDVCSR